MIKESLRQYYFLLKTAAYVVLGFMLYSNLIGPEGIAEFFKVEDPSEEGLNRVGILIPQYVLYWTLGTVALEVIGNVASCLNITKYDDKPLTKGDFRDEMRKRDKDKFETNIRMIKRIAKIEEKLKDK